MVVHVAEPFRPFAEEALVRLRYLYPAATFTLTPIGIEIGGDSGIPPDALSREVNYALYREKIYADTLTMRRDLIEAVTRR